MPRVEGQKGKILLLLRILERYSDEEHLISVPRILELLAVRKLCISQIESIICGEPLDAAELPSVTVIRAAKGQSLWELGKKYHSTAKLIAAQNGMEDAECVEGRMLIIPTART